MLAKLRPLGTMAPYPSDDRATYTATSTGAMNGRNSASKRRFKRRESKVQGAAQPVSEWRRRFMARVRTRNTNPELLTRRLLHRLGYRFRLQAEGLPYRPDIIFSGRKIAIFVHGCFWHGHAGCKKGRTRPRVRQRFWTQKIVMNRRRDQRIRSELFKLGWTTIEVWECELKNASKAENGLVKALGPVRRSKIAATRGAGQNKLERRDKA